MTGAHLLQALLMAACMRGCGACFRITLTKMDDDSPDSEVLSFMAVALVLGGASVALGIMLLASPAPVYPD